MLQYEPYDFCISLLYKRKNAEKPDSCFTKIIKKICKTDVKTVSDIDEDIKRAHKIRKEEPATYYVSFNS